MKNNIRIRFRDIIFTTDNNESVNTYYLFSRE